MQLQLCKKTGMRIKFLWNIYALLPKVKPNQIYRYIEEFQSSVPLKTPPYNFINLYFNRFSAPF